MVKEIGTVLKEWETDDRVQVVVIKGAGERGLCAGGDMKQLYMNRTKKSFLQMVKQYFEEEYRTDLAVYQFPKPIIACLDGIVMGGGVGLTYGASHRIVTERTKWAMPEMDISFFPDVGAAYFLNKAPGYSGRYLALTSSIIGAADVLYIKGADIYMNSDNLASFLTHLEKVNWHDASIHSQLASLISQYENTLSIEENSKLMQFREQIDRHFSNNSMEEIIASLAKDNSRFAEETKKTLLSVSPTSLKVTLKHLIAGEKMSLQACLEKDVTLALNFATFADFFEGVRSVLIDKDRNPQYQYKRLEDVSDELVDSFFKQ